MFRASRSLKVWEIWDYLLLEMLTSCSLVFWEIRYCRLLETLTDVGDFLVFFFFKFDVFISAGYQ